MAKIIIPSDAPYEINGSDNVYVLRKNGSIDGDTNEPAITDDMDAHDNTLIIKGFVEGGFHQTIRISGDDTDIVIAKTGSVAGEGTLDTIMLDGDDQSLINNGTIDGAICVDITGDAVFTNNGKITGAVGAITHSAVGDIMLGDNSRIYVSDMGIQRLSLAGVESLTTNKGLLNSGDLAFDSQDGNETLINSGKIVGNINLGGGEDHFDSRNGTFNGTIDGGAGSDTYFIGKGNITIHETAEIVSFDTVRSKVSYALDADAEIEKLVLVGNKDLHAFGSDSENILVGNKGDNRLSGLFGDDQLRGGAGDDLFVFKTGFGADVIQDFTDKHDRIDVSGWKGIEDFADLKSHMTSVGGGVLISMDDDDSLFITNTMTSELDKNDFVF